MSTRTISDVFQGVSGTPPAGARVDISLAGPVLKTGVSVLDVASVALTVGNGIDASTGAWSASIIDSDTTGQLVRVRESINGAPLRSNDYEIPAGATTLNLAALTPSTPRKDRTPFLSSDTHREDVNSETWGHEVATLFKAGFMSPQDKATATSLLEALEALNQGSTSQTYLPDGVGAISRSVAARLKETISVYDFGAKGDGVTDDTASINAAITRANAIGGAIVQLPPGVYKCNGQIVLKDGVTLMGAGPSATRFDFTASTATVACIYGEGSIAALPAFSVNIAKNDKTITFPSDPGVAAGDVLVIYNSANSSWSAARTYYRAGEMVRVRSVAGNVVTLEHAVFDSYSAGATTAIYKMTPITAAVKSLGATFKSGVVGLKVKFGVGVVYDDLDLTGSILSQASFDKCFEATATRVRADDGSPNTSNHYGIAVGNSQRVIIAECFLSTTRHGFSMGGDDATGAIVCREILVQNNVIGSKDDSNYGLDAHGNVEWIVYRDNFLPNGMVVGGDNVLVAGNTIRTTKQAIGINVGEPAGPNFTFDGNRIDATEDYGGSGTAGLINFGRGTNAPSFLKRDGTIRILNNHFTMSGYGGIAIGVRNLYSSQNIDLEIVGNTVTADAGGVTRYAAEIFGGSGFGLRNILMKGNAFRFAGVQLTKTGSPLIHVEGNTFFRAAIAGFSMTKDTAYTASQADQLILFLNNVVYRPGKATVVLTGDGDGSKTKVVVTGNHSEGAAQDGTTGATATDSSLYVTGVNLAIVQNNVFGKDPLDTASAQSRLMAFNVITTLYEDNNLNIGTVSTVNATSITNRLSRFTYNGNNREAWGTAAPAAGTWKVGDRVWNTAPAAGGTVGWVCTAAGTPGTWKAFGTIAA